LPTALAKLGEEKPDEIAKVEGKALPGPLPSNTDETTSHEPRKLPVPSTIDISDETGRCPFLETSFDVCGVCHREGER